jgi:hypothetical protein
MSIDYLNCFVITLRLIIFAPLIAQLRFRHCVKEVKIFFIVGFGIYKYTIIAEWMGETSKFNALIKQVNGK